MPEQNERDDRERGPEGAEATAPVADVKGLNNNDTSAEPHFETNAPQEDAAAEYEGLKPASAEPGIPDDFAASVILGLEQASLDRDTEAENSAETFFAGWGALDAPPEPISELQPPSAAGSLSPDPSSLLQGFNDFSPLSDVEQPGEIDESVKHDALAEAVQSALMSVYGASSQTEAGDDQQVSAGFGTQARKKPSAQQQSVFSDDLSPQDVILSYFNYETGSAEKAPNGGERFESQNTGTFQGYRGNPPSAFLENRLENTQNVAEIDASRSSSGVRYDGPPSYQLPVASQAKKTRNQQAQRESGRLLGAAGIGLIGGIAIAASLAVFTINSYGPQSPKAPEGGDPQRQDRARGSENYGTAADRSSGRALPTESASRLPTAAEAQKPAPLSPPVETPSEVIAADVTASSGQPVPLTIAVKSPLPLEQTLVSISGVPQGARLNAGVDAGGGNWLLPPRRLNGLTLSLPADIRESVVLNVELLDTNARSPLSDKRQFRVRSDPAAPVVAALRPNVEAESARPSAAPIPTAAQAFNTQTVPAPKLPEIVITPPASPAPSPFTTQTVPAQSTTTLTNAQVAVAPPGRAEIVPPSSQAAAPSRRPISQLEIEDLIREGNRKMREGDIVSARELYLRAINMGDADAALAMGRSFDPIYFERIERKNAEADPAKAFEWYKKAMDSGAVQTARVRIENLKQHLNK